MEFKITTIFEKYKIEPNIEKEKIKLIFQTDPNKRKDLPIVLKIISSDEKLFEEELFTKHNDKLLEKHTKLDELIEVAKNKSISSDYKIIANLIIEIANEEDYYKKFYYSNKINEVKAKKIFDDYLMCIIDKLKHEFYGSIGEINDDSLKNMYNSISSIFTSVEMFKEQKEEFEEDLCDYLNNIFTLDNNGKELAKRFSSLIYLNKYIKNDYYTNSIKYTLEKMNKNVDIYDNVLIESYEYICNVFKGENLKEVSSFISNLIFRNLHLRAEKNLTESKKSLKKLKLLQNCCLLYKKNKSIDDKDFDTAEELCDFMVFAGEEWQTKYNEAFKEMIEDSTEDNIYNVVELIVEQNPTDEVLRIFANVITDITGFNNLLEYILKTHEASINKTSDKYINPTDVDLFIAKYYWLSFTKFDSNITKEFFDKIRALGFDILAINEASMKLIDNPYFDYDIRNLIRRKVLDTYQTLPGDWVMEDGTTIRQMFEKLGEVFNGSDGVSSTKIKEYNSLFRKMKKSKDNQYHCPNCDYPIIYDEEKCGKCGIKLDWSSVDDISEYYGDDDYEEENKNTTNYSSQKSSDNSGIGCLIWFIIGSIIFIIIVANNS